MKNDDTSDETKFDEGARVDSDQSDRAEERAKQKAESGNNGTDNEPPGWLIPKPYDELSAHLPPQLMKGLLYQGGRIAFGGSPKAHKSFLLMQLCHCIENAIPFLDIEVARGRTIHLDLELFEGECRQRLDLIAKALGPYPHHQRVNVISARDKAGKFRDKSVVHAFNQIIAAHSASLLTIDPTYKFHDADERDTSAMKQALEDFESKCGQANCSIATANHYTKGNPAAKDAMERMAGSYFQRSADVILVFTDLEETDTYVVNIIQRSFKPIEPFGIRFQYPIFVRDDSLDLSRIRQPDQRQSTGDAIKDRMLSVLQAADFDGGLIYTDWLRHTQLPNKKGKLTPGKSWFDVKRKELLKAGLVIQNPVSEKYHLSPAYSARHAQQAADQNGK
ncbi:MAG TPA: AAA family ATPase [Chthoniobacterales bacterium]|nr:AAA family ATPase [Chthoniobacterales bacterium]